MDIFGFLRNKSLPVETRSSPVPVVRRRPRRSYAAAGTKAYYGDFKASPGSANYELITALPIVRNKIRALARNSGTGKRYLQLLKDNVVGDNGFQLRVRVPLVTAPEKFDRTLNRTVERAWSDFCEKPTVDTKLDMIELEKMMVSTWGRDGEFIIEIVEGVRYADGFALNPIEGDQLDETLNTIHPPTGNLIKMGVEVDLHNKPIAYHFLNQHPGDTSWMSPMTKKRYRRVLANRVVHIFERLRAGQTRGEPPASSIVNTTKMLDGYREAEVTGRRVKASAMGLIVETPEAQAGAGNGLDGMADRVDEADEAFEMDVEPGTFKKLPKGYDIKMFDPGGAQSDYAQFEQQIKTDNSMGVGISPVSLGYETGKLSYSTHRGIIGEDRTMYKGLQSFFIRMAMKVIFEKWLNYHMTYNLDTQIMPSRVKRILKYAKFMGRGWDYIDPSKDAEADNKQMASLSTSLSRVMAKRGVALEDHLEEIKSDNELLKQYGLTQSLGDGNSDETTSGKDDVKKDDDDDDDDA